MPVVKPTNEEPEKAKFKANWDKGKVYNPRFQYKDWQAAKKVVDTMKVVYSTKYRTKAKQVMDEIIKIYGNAENYKDQVWGKRIYKDEILDICE